MPFHKTPLPVGEKREHDDEEYSCLLVEGEIDSCPIETIVDTDLRCVETTRQTYKTLGIQSHTPICWNEEGTLFYYVNMDHEICCYESADGTFRRSRVFRGPSSEILQLLYSSGRRCLYSCGADGLFLWDLQQEGKCTQLLAFPVCCLCSILDDSVLVAGTPDGTLLLLDSLDQYIQLDRLHPHKSAVTCLHFIPSRRLLASCSLDSSIHLFSLTSNHARTHSTLQGHVGAVTCLASSPDGQLLASGGKDHAVRLWNLDSAKCLRCVEDCHTPSGKHRGGITVLAFLGEKLLSAGMDGCVKCFRLGAAHSSIDEEMDSLSLDSLSLDGLSLDSLLHWRAGPDDRSLGVSPDLPDASAPSDVLEWSVQLAECGVAHLAFDARQRALVSTAEREVRVYSERFAEALLRLRSPTRAVTAVRLDRWCRLLAGSLDHSVMVCDGQSDAVVAWREESTAVCALAVAGGWVVVPGPGYSLRVVNSAWEECFRLEGHRGQITGVAMNGMAVVSCSYDGTVLLHVLPSQSLPSSSSSAAASTAAATATTAAATTTTSHNTYHSINPISSLSYHHGVVTTVDFTTLNGMSYVVSGGSDYSLVVCHVVHSQMKVSWSHKSAHAGVITRVLFGVGMACGVVYSAARDHTVRVWSLKNGELVGTLASHAEKVVDVCQSPDGRFFVSAAADNRILVYDVSDKYQVVMQVECCEEPSCLAIVDNMVCCGFCSGGIRFWMLPPLGIHYT